MAAATGASKRGLAVLMYALVGLELLHRDETDRFGLTPESAAFLVSSKPEANLGRIFSHISTQLIPAWLDLVEVIRTGRPATKRDNLAEKGAFFASFVESILPLGWPAASTLAEHLRIEAALAPGGVVAIAEFLVEPDRSGPLMGLIFAANMLVNTEAGNTYSFEEVHGWLKDAGFEQVRTLDVPGPSPLILATRPR